MRFKKNVIVNKPFLVPVNSHLTETKQPEGLCEGLSLLKQVVLKSDNALLERKRRKNR